MSLSGLRDTYDFCYTSEDTELTCMYSFEALSDQMPLIPKPTPILPLTLALIAHIFSLYKDILKMQLVGYVL